MAQIENEYSVDGSYENALDFPDEPIEGFGKLDEGLQSDGVVLSCLGWASVRLTESLEGILIRFRGNCVSAGAVRSALYKTQV